MAQQLQANHDPAHHQCLLSPQVTGSEPQRCLLPAAQACARPLALLQAVVSVYRLLLMLDPGPLPQALCWPSHAACSGAGASCPIEHLAAKSERSDSGKQQVAPTLAVPPQRCLNAAAVALPLLLVSLRQGPAAKQTQGTEARVEACAGRCLRVCLAHLLGAAPAEEDQQDLGLGWDGWAALGRGQAARAGVSHGGGCQESCGEPPARPAQLLHEEASRLAGTCRLRRGGSGHQQSACQAGPPCLSCQPPQGRASLQA